MKEISYPVVKILKSGGLEYSRNEEELLKSNTFLLNKGIFNNMFIIDSNGNKFKVLKVSKLKSFGYLWGLTLLFHQNIILDIVFEDKIQSISLKEFKPYFESIYKKDARTLGGIVDKKELKFIQEANSIKEIINNFSEAFYKVYPT